MKPGPGRGLAQALLPDGAPEPRPIGVILVESGRLSPDAAERILALQEREGLRFGDAALRLKLLDESDIMRALAAQYAYPVLVPGATGVSPEVVCAFEPFGPATEAFRMLRSQLMLRGFGREADKRFLALVSPGRGEGRSYVAANLAVAFAQMGKRILLVDTDLRHPRLHALFGLPNRVGLSSLLSRRGEAGVFQSLPGLPGISLLTSGPTPPNPQELLGRPAFAALLDELALDHDVVLFDTPAARGCADAQLVASRAGHALVVARRNRTRKRQIEELALALEACRAQVVGTVMEEF